jgi:hypothetical protein
MSTKQRITEEDLKATEALLAISYANMKHSLARIPGDIVKPVTGTVKAHPYASLAAAAGAGLIGYELINLMTPRVVTKEVNVPSRSEVKEHASSSMVSQIMTFAAPYVVSYLQQEVTRLLTQPRHNEDIK